ncbi:MAG: 4Fe-4S binding protein [Candidatus Freyrarchaeum guaymaensis]|nr:NADH-quinone oxidoreductase subunit I [Candidatus Sigynarchaeota archaeon]
MPRPAAMEPELLRNFPRKPFTVFYPFERLPPAEGLRGRQKLYLKRCVGCGTCAKDCPSGAIEMIDWPDEFPQELKNKAGKVPKVDLGKCLFCEQCVESCPRDALEMTQEYELATFDRKAMEWIVDMETE